MALDELGLIIKGVQLAAGARAENDQHLVRLGLEVRVAGGKGFTLINPGPERSLGCQEAFILQQTCQGNPAQSLAGVP